MLLLPLFCEARLLNQLLGILRRTLDETKIKSIQEAISNKCLTSSNKKLVVTLYSCSSCSVFFKFLSFFCQFFISSFEL